MDQYLGSWGLYQWFDEHGPDLIHHDDLEEMRRFSPNGKVFRCVSDDGQFITLQHGGKCFRVKPALFKPIVAPAFDFGDLVSFMKEGRVVIGTIVEIAWHFQKEQPFYLVEVDGKRLSKRYWVTELNRMV